MVLFERFLLGANECFKMASKKIVIEYEQYINEFDDVR